MSKPFLAFSVIILTIFICSSEGVRAQQTKAALDVKAGSKLTVSVTLDFPARRQLSFLRSVAGVENLPVRLSNLKLSDSPSGPAIKFHQLVPGEYLADSDFTHVSYDIDLSLPKQRTAAAHVSWNKGDLGILMLADLLPQLGKNVVTVTFSENSPYVSSIHLESGKRIANVEDAENAVFYIGSGWRGTSLYRGNESSFTYLSDSWHFSDEEFTTLVRDIVEEYTKLFEPKTPIRAQVAIAKFPVATPPGEWQAETRGRSVTIISSDMPFKGQSLQRLHEQLRHELFHLWIPNGVNLTGNYDWFYEGFALYESLKLGLRVNRISFADFLDTLSRAHTIDSAIPPKISLIQASANRFSGSNTQIYARGMLVAFLTDIAMLQRSKGKRSVEDLLVEIIRLHGRPQPPADGNAAVIKILRSQTGVGEVVDKYVEGTRIVDVGPDLSAVGLEDMVAGPGTALRVKEKLSGAQKALLDKLSYNSWRKLPVPTK